MSTATRSEFLRRGVRRALISSAATLPLCVLASEAFAQSAQPPIADAGPDATIADTNNQFGETVTLQGSGSSRNVSGSNTLTFQWFDAEQQPLATGPTPTITLPDGVNQLQLVVTDNCCSSSSTLTTTSLVTITVLEPARNPTADAGPDRAIADTDGASGESVTLQGSGFSNAGEGSESLSFVWTLGDQQLATGPTPTVRLPDGSNELVLAVTDNCCSSSGSLVSMDTVTIDVAAPNRGPTANAGPDQTIADSDRRPGERVTLDASASTDADGTITSYTWSIGETTLGSGPVLNDVELSDGQNTVTLVVTDNNGNTGVDTVVISIAVPPPRARLSDIAQTPNQRAMARTLDDLCSRLLDVSFEDEGGEPSQPGEFKPSAAARVMQARGPEEISDLAARCEGILSDPSAANQRKALDELSAQDFNAMRTPTVVFSQTQFQSVMDRLVALRAGQRGTSVAGLNLRIGDQFVSLEDIATSLRDALGGGASSDEGGLFSDKLGFWMRGNYGIGEKSRTSAGIGFESDQWGLTGGVDYRLGTAGVAGLSIGYGKSTIDFNPISQGGIDTRALAASIYGSGYVGALYIDGVLNYVDADYDTQRRILYNEGSVEVDRTALGSTTGDALSGGAAIGYDFAVGALTIAPSIGYYYVDTVIDPFSERGAAGLDLAFDEQNYTSSTANVGVRASYAWKTSWGVFIPHVRGTYVREFEDSAEVFGVRFANDPFASAANPTPPIIVESDRIDRSYIRLAAGASLQFAFGIAGYFEYQRLEAYEQVSFHDFTIGLRLSQRF